MRFMVFEYGQSHTDVQSRVLEFDGGLYEYDKKQLELFKNNPDKIELIRSGYTDGNNCLFYVYHSKFMD